MYLNKNELFFKDCYMHQVLKMLKLKVENIKIKRYPRLIILVLRT